MTTGVLFLENGFRRIAHHGRTGLSAFPGGAVGVRRAMGNGRWAMLARYSAQGGAGWAGLRHRSYGVCTVYHSMWYSTVYVQLLGTLYQTNELTVTPHGLGA